MATDVIANPVIFQSDVTFVGTIQTKFARTQLQQDSEQIFIIPLTSMRVWDAYGTVLPGTAASDDLGLIGGTFATASPVLQTIDSKNASTTAYARFQVQLPPEYDDGETVKLRAFAGMDTTVASSSATVDFQAYEIDGEGGIGSDLVTTSATTINSLTNAAKDFTLTSSGLVKGDILDVRVAIAIVDSATATAVIGEIGYIALVCDIKG